MNWLYRFVIYLFVNASRVTLNDGTMDSSSDYRTNLDMVRESLEFVVSQNDNNDCDGICANTAFYNESRVDSENSFFDYLLSQLRFVMTQITDLPEKHRARLRFSSD